MRTALAQKNSVLQEGSRPGLTDSHRVAWRAPDLSAPGSDGETHLLLASGLGGAGAWGGIRISRGPTGKSTPLQERTRGVRGELCTLSSLPLGPGKGAKGAHKSYRGAWTSTAPYGSPLLKNLGSAPCVPPRSLRPAPPTALAQSLEISIASISQRLHYGALQSAWTPSCLLMLLKIHLAQEWV